MATSLTAQSVGSRGWARRNQQRKRALLRAQCGPPSEHPSEFIARWRYKRDNSPEELGKRTPFEGPCFEYIFCHDPTRSLHSNWPRGMRAIQAALQQRNASIIFAQPPGATFAPDPLSSATGDIVSAIDSSAPLSSGTRLVAESWGALAALAAAAQRPKSVDAVVLIAPPLAPSEALEALAGSSEQLEKWRSFGSIDIGLGNDKKLPWQFALEAERFAGAENVVAKAMVFVGHSDLISSLAGSKEWTRRAAHLANGRERRLIELRKSEDSEEIPMARLIEFLDLPPNATSINS